MHYPPPPPPSISSGGSMDKMLSFTLKFLCDGQEALSGELSCTWTRLVIWSTGVAGPPPFLAQKSFLGGRLSQSCCLYIQHFMIISFIDDSGYTDVMLIVLSRL